MKQMFKKITNYKAYNVIPRKGIILTMLGITLSGTSCVDEIELDLDPEQYSRLIVHATVTDTDSAQTVILKKTIPYDKNEPNPPATGADVSIKVGEVLYDLPEVSPGYYESNEFKGEVGQSYTLSILYEDEIYTATSTMYEKFETDSIRFKKFPYGIPEDMPHYEILIYGQDPPDPEQVYLFKYSVNGVWVDTLYNWSIYTDVFNNGEYLDGESVGIIESKADSLEVQVKAMSISEEYLWFINDAIMNYMPNMFFSPPKANVKGNISNGAFGFFQASAVHSSEKKTLYKKDFGW